MTETISILQFNEQNIFFRSACSIPLDDKVVLTGGRGRTHLDSLTRVSMYNRGGWMTDMPSLKKGRYDHGCTSFTTGGELVRLTI